MASKPTSFWTRFTKAIKPRPWSDDASNNLRRFLILKSLDRAGNNPLPNPAETSDNETDAPPEDKPIGPLARWNKREQAIAQLQQGYQRVTQVVEEIHQHLMTQGERTDRIANSLEQLQQSLSDLPAIAHQQTEALAAIAERLETTGNRTQELTDVIKEIPHTTRMQTNTLATINLQLERANDQSAATSETMGKLGTAIHTLDESNTAQVKALQSMGKTAKEQNHQLNLLIAQQSKRFIGLFVVTVLLAAAAITTAIIGITK